MDKKTAIIQTAIRLFADKGYAFTTVDEIAKASGMTKPSFYKYFPGKEDLLLEAMEMLAKKVEGKVRKLYRSNNLSKNDRIIQLITIYLESIFKHRTYILLFMVPILPLSENEKIQNASTVIERKLFVWFYESIVDLYGEQVEDNAADITFIAITVLLDYIRVFGTDLSDDHIYRLAAYVEHLIKVLVKGMQSNKPPMPLLLEPPVWLANCGPQEFTPFWRARQLQRCFLNMESAIKNHESLTELEKKEYLEAIAKMKVESNDSLTPNVVLKALLFYLEQLDVLREECGRFRLIYEGSGALEKPDTWP